MRRSVAQKDHAGGGWLGEDKIKDQEPNWETSGTMQMRKAVGGNWQSNRGNGGAAPGRVGD